MTLPNGAEYEHFGLPYKVGRFGRLYRWNGIEWIRSSKTIHDILAEKRRKEKDRERAAKRAKQVKED